DSASSGRWRGQTGGGDRFGEEVEDPLCGRPAQLGLRHENPVVAAVADLVGQDADQGVVAGRGVSGHDGQTDSGQGRLGVDVEVVRLQSDVFGQFGPQRLEFGDSGDRIIGVPCQHVPFEVVEAANRSVYGQIVLVGVEADLVVGQSAG